MTCVRLLIPAMAALLAVAGCSPDARHRTLSFFFDGVPGPDAKPAEAPARRRTAAPASATAGKALYRSHGPYAAQLCEACHYQGGGKLVMPVEDLCLYCHDLNIRRKHIHGPVASGGCRVCHDPHGSGKAFLLVSDSTTFCFTCHDEAEVGSREVHAGAKGMQCTDCHDPHSSDNDFILK
jgi:predicted CXXCH cytochrome family protein